MLDITKKSLREMRKMLKRLDRPGWAYWLAWGVVLSLMSFGAANVITALRL